MEEDFACLLACCFKLFPNSSRLWGIMSGLEMGTWLDLIGWGGEEGRGSRKNGVKEE